MRAPLGARQVWPSSSETSSGWPYPRMLHEPMAVGGAPQRMHGPLAGQANGTGSQVWPALVVASTTGGRSATVEAIGTVGPVEPLGLVGAGANSAWTPASSATKPRNWRASESVGAGAGCQLWPASRVT